MARPEYGWCNMRARPFILVCLLAAPLDGKAMEDMFDFREIIASPTPQHYSVCLDHSCATIVTDALSDSEWREVTAPLRRPPRGAADERADIGRSMALFETVVGRHTGTSGDRGRNAAGFGQPGQLDCIDESTNTTTYLKLLEREGLLRYHRVAERATRFGLFVGMPHSTAVIEELDSRNRYVVDSWFYDNGQPPHIVRLEDWYSGQDPVDD
jgi:hypothetical protein